MLQIRIANISVDVSDTISIVLTSPYPGMASGMPGGNFVYNIRVAATDALRRAYGFAHRPGTRNNTQLPFDINAYGMRWSGLAEVVTAGPDYYEIMCPLGNGDFNARSKDIRLPQLDFGGDLSKPFDACVARSSSDINFNLSGEAPFSVEQVLTFPTITHNTGELSADGTTFIADNTKTLQFKFDVFAMLDASERSIRIYKNGSLVRSVNLSGLNEQVSAIVDVVEGDEITFSLYLFSLGGAEYTISGSFFKNTKLTVSVRQLASSMLDGALYRYPDINYAVFPLHNPYAFDLWPDDEFQVDNQSLKTIYSQFIRVMNYWYNNAFPGTITVTADDDESFTAGNLFVPFPYIAFIVQRVADRFGLRIVNNVFNDELKYSVLINHYLENYFIDERMLAANTSLRINDHVPDWSVYDFMQNICSLFALGYEVDNAASTIEFHFVKDLLSEDYAFDISHLAVGKPVADWHNNPKAFTIKSQYPSECKLSSEIKSPKGLNILGAVNTFADLPESANVNDAYLVLMFDKYFAWNYNPDTYEFGWVMHSRRYVNEVNTGENATEIDCKLASVVNNNYVDNIQLPDIYREWSIPANHQPAEFEGAPEVYRGSWVPFVCWYHGLHNDGLGQPYPFGSADMVDFSGKEIPGVPFSLHLGGSRGRYNMLWREFISWRQSAKPVRIQFIPDRHFLRQFRFHRQLRLAGVNYLVVEIRGNIGQSGPDVWELLALVV